jgi:hypothetical protein
VHNQIHDYAPPIAPNGLFWTVPIHPNNVKVKLKSGRASLRAEGLAVPDAHDLANSLTHGKGLATQNPPIPPIAPVPATVSFDVEWFPVPASHKVSLTTVVNESQNFRGDFIKTGSTIRWSSNQHGFFFDSEAPDPSRLIGAVIGRERNGIFFNAKNDREDEDDDDRD